MTTKLLFISSFFLCASIIGALPLSTDDVDGMRRAVDAVVNHVVDYDSKILSPRDAGAADEDTAAYLFRLADFLDKLKQRLDRLVNKLVDDTAHNFPALRRAIEHMEKAIKNWRLTKLGLNAVLKTLSTFTKAFHGVRERLVAADVAPGVVRWMDESVKGLCYVLAMFKTDCGYPDYDTVGGTV